MSDLGQARAVQPDRMAAQAAQTGRARPSRDVEGVVQRLLDHVLGHQRVAGRDRLLVAPAGGALVPAAWRWREPYPAAAPPGVRL